MSKARALVRQGSAIVAAAGFLGLSGFVAYVHLDWGLSPDGAVWWPALWAGGVSSVAFLLYLGLLACVYRKRALRERVYSLAVLLFWFALPGPYVFLAAFWFPAGLSAGLLAWLAVSVPVAMLLRRVWRADEPLRRGSLAWAWLASGCAGALLSVAIVLAARCAAEAIAITANLSR